MIAWPQTVNVDSFVYITLQNMEWTLVILFLWNNLSMFTASAGGGSSDLYTQFTFIYHHVFVPNEV